MTPLSPGEQLFLGFMALMVAGFYIGAWSWCQAIRADIATARRVRAAVTEYAERQAALDRADDSLIAWNQQVWTELDRSGL